MSKFLCNTMQISNELLEDSKYLFDLLLNQIEWFLLS